MISCVALFFSSWFGASSFSLKYIKSFTTWYDDKRFMTTTQPLNHIYRNVSFQLCMCLLSLLQKKKWKQWKKESARIYKCVCVSFCLHCTNVAYFNSMSHSLSDARQVVVYFCFNCRYVEMVLRFTSFWFTTPFMCIKHWHSMCIVNACSIKMNDEIHRRQWLVIELKRESFGRLWWWWRWRQCHGMQWHANITNMCKCTSISKQL